MDALVYERADAERQMIRAGLLEGVTPQDIPDLMRDERPQKDIREQEKAEAAAKASAKATVDLQAAAASVEPREPAKAYAFPGRRKGEDMEAQRFYDSLTPEQKLKLEALSRIFQVEARDILDCGLSVDEVFRLAANDFTK